MKKKSGKFRIKDVSIWNNRKYIGFSMKTNAGFAQIGRRRDSVGNKATLSRLKGFLPHIYKTLAQRDTWSEEDLKDLLVGRYIYAELREREIDGVIYPSLEPWTEHSVAKSYQMLIKHNMISSCIEED